MAKERFDESEFPTPSSSPEGFDDIRFDVTDEADPKDPFGRELALDSYREIERETGISIEDILGCINKVNEESIDRAEQDGNEDGLWCCEYYLKMRGRKGETNTQRWLSILKKHGRERDYYKHQAESAEDPDRRGECKKMLEVYDKLGIQ